MARRPANSGPAIFPGDPNDVDAGLMNLIVGSLSAATAAAWSHEGHKIHVALAAGERMVGPRRLELPSSWTPTRPELRRPDSAGLPPYDLIKATARLGAASGGVEAVRSSASRSACCGAMRR